MPVPPAPYRLPNGLAVYQHRPYETDFVYREVFVEQVYTRHFTDIPPAPCVVDVGANIGLFSLFIKQHYPQAQVYAFEPSPAHFELLVQNIAGLEDVHCFREGLGETMGQKILTYYPDYSLLSGFRGNPDSDRQLLSAGVAHQLQLDPGSSEDAKYVELLVEGKLDRVEHIECPVTTLSCLIQSYAIPQIDLLKIDAEKAEVDVLAGIAPAHWPLIKKLAIEAHSEAHAVVISDTLRQHGYTVMSEKIADCHHTALFTLWAQR